MNPARCQICCSVSSSKKCSRSTLTASRSRRPARAEDCGLRRAVRVLSAVSWTVLVAVSWTVLIAVVAAVLVVAATASIIVAAASSVVVVVTVLTDLKDRALAPADGGDLEESAHRVGDAALLADYAAHVVICDEEVEDDVVLGLSVRTSDGRDLGTLEEVLANPGGDVYVVRGPLGEVLIPAHEDFVLEVNLESRTITIEPVPGLLPDPR